MPRPERRLDPGDGVVERFAAELRTVRNSAGRPGYRELARRAHFSATTLSEAAGGRKLPSLAVTLDGLSESHIRNVAISNSTFTNVATAKPSVKNADGTTFTNVTINGKKV